MWFDKQSQTVRILLLIPFWGWIVSGLYRIFKYTRTKNMVTLIVGVVSFFFFGVILSIIDLITTITDNKISFLAD